MAQQWYCPSCGEDVDTLSIMKNGVESISCSNCGLTLNKKKKIKTLKSVMLVEDTPAILKKVAEMLLVREIASTVIPCEHGEVFLEKTISRMRKNEPISLIILDINMPILNGVNAAIAWRSVERALQFGKKVPIIFFSANKCNEDFKKVLQYCAPAHYINKGSGSNPEDFAGRLYDVISVFLEGN